MKGVPMDAPDYTGVMGPPSFLLLPFCLTIFSRTLRRW